jgi:hypothetical protein
MNIPWHKTFLVQVNISIDLGHWVIPVNSFCHSKWCKQILRVTFMRWSVLARCELARAQHTPQAIIARIKVELLRARSNHTHARAALAQLRESKSRRAFSRKSKHARRQCKQSYSGFRNAFVRKQFGQRPLLSPATHFVYFGPSRKVRTPARICWQCRRLRSLHRFSHQLTLSVMPLPTLCHTGKFCGATLHFDRAHILPLRLSHQTSGKWICKLSCYEQSLCGHIFAKRHYKHTISDWFWLYLHNFLPLHCWEVICI